MVAKYICGICKKKVKYENYPIQCDVCNCWFHGTCEKLSKKTWTYLGESDYDWFCSNCVNKSFPFWSLSNEELETLLSDLTENEKILIEKCMLYEKVKVDFDKFDIDSDTKLNVCNENVDSHYVTHKQMSKLNTVIHENFSFIHFNARSLVKNFDNIERMLKVNEVEFSVIGITETWLNE